MARVIDDMTALYNPKTLSSNDHVVLPPRTTDAVGKALRCAYGAGLGTPADMVQLVQQLDRTR